MNWNIFTEYPLWFVLFCIALGLTYALVLYYRESRSEFPVFLKGILGALRFFVITAISFLLLSPFIRSIERIRQKPYIIIVQDNSASVVINSDSAFYRNEYLASIDRLAGDLDAIGEVKKYTFGEEVRALPAGAGFSGSVGYTDRLTDLSALFGEMENLYSNLNVGALIIASDGIYNTGSNPIYSSSGWTFPVYTLALGDTSVRKDLVLSRVNYNRMVYMDNKFPVEIVIHGNDCQSQNTFVKVYQGDNELFSKEVLVDRQDFTLTLNAILEARELGLKKYRVVLEPVPGEVSTANNFKEVFIEVQNAKISILLLSNAPHPDITALKQTIGSSLNYEVEHYQYGDFQGTSDKYNLVILHGLPSLSNQAEALFSKLVESRTPVLYIISGQTDLNRFNRLRLGLSIISERNNFEEAIPELNPNFMLFSLSEDNLHKINDFPPLISPLGDYQIIPAMNVLMTQRIGSVRTSRPLVMFIESLDNRTGIIAGEGIWKWRISNYLKTGGHEVFDELFNKIFQYLSVRDVKKKFRVYNQGNYMENERALFESELFNDAYELITGPEVEMVITTEEGAQFPYVFTRAGNSYRLDAGSFPPGNYSYQATARVGDETLSSSGQFSVSKLDQEAVSLVADFSTLYALASQKQGKMYKPGELDELRDELLNRDDIRPVIYSQKRFSELISLPMVLLLILSLLAIEWFLRKRAGGY